MKAFVIAIVLLVAPSWAAACDVNQLRLEFGYSAPIQGYYSAPFVQGYALPQTGGCVQGFVGGYSQPFTGGYSGYSLPIGVGYGVPIRSFGFAAYRLPRAAFVGPGRQFRRTPLRPFVGPVPRRW